MNLIIDVLNFFYLPGKIWEMEMSSGLMSMSLFCNKVTTCYSRVSSSSWVEFSVVCCDSTIGLVLMLSPEMITSSHLVYCSKSLTFCSSSAIFLSLLLIITFNCFTSSICDHHQFLLWCQSSQFCTHKVEWFFLFAPCCQSYYLLSLIFFPACMYLPWLTGLDGGRDSDCGSRSSRWLKPLPGTAAADPLLNGTGFQVPHQQSQGLVVEAPGLSAMSTRPSGIS